MWIKHSGSEQKQWSNIFCIKWKANFILWRITICSEYSYSLYTMMPLYLLHVCTCKLYCRSQLSHENIFLQIPTRGGILINNIYLYSFSLEFQLPYTCSVTLRSTYIYQRWALALFSRNYTYTESENPKLF